MSTEYSIVVKGVVFPTSEHFYQCMKYVDHPEVQREIIGEKNPLLMKNKQKRHRALIRKDWDELKEVIMEVTVQLKLVTHWVKFGNLLLESGTKEIELLPPLAEEDDLPEGVIYLDPIPSEDEAA